MMIELVAALSLAPPPTTVKTNEPVASALTEISPSRTKRFSYAEKLFHEERFVESAVEFESLWLEYHNVRYLYNAALARQRAGHLGHAAAYLSDYVKSPKTSAELRISAARLLEHIREGLVVVDVRIEGPHATTLHATFQGGFLSEQRHTEIRLPVVDQRCTVYLDPGIWHLAAVGKDASSKVVEIVVRPTQDPAKAEVEMKRNPRKSRLPRESWRPKITATNAGLGLGIGIVGAAFLGIGLPSYADKIQSIEGVFKGETLVSLDFGQLKQPADFGATGAGLVAAGVGLAGSGTLSLLKTRRSRKIANTAVLTLGIGVGAVGALATGFIREDRNAVLDGLIARTSGMDYASSFESGLGLFQGDQARLLGTSVIVGFGTGLALGSAIAIVVETVKSAKLKTNREKVVLTPSISVVDNRARLIVSGRF